MRKLVYLLLLLCFFSNLFAETDERQQVDTFFNQCEKFNKVYSPRNPSREQPVFDQVTVICQELKLVKTDDLFLAFSNSNREFRTTIKALTFYIDEIEVYKKNGFTELNQVYYGIANALLFKKNLNNFYLSEEYQSVREQRKTAAVAIAEKVDAVEKSTELKPPLKTENTDAEASSEKTDSPLKADVFVVDLKQEEPQKQKFSVILISPVVLVLLICLLIIIRVNKKQKHDLTKAVLDAREQERSKISSELHDTVGQMLKNIRQNADSTMNQEKLEELLKTTDDCIKEIRSICYNLMPPDFNLENYENKFEQMVYYLVKNISQTTKINIKYAADENLPEITDPEKLVNLFRIVQEALNNVKKHSNASNASVVLRKKRENNKLLIFITDNGVGIKREILSNGIKGHFGLNSMKERARLIGAELNIESIENDGTNIRIEL